MLFGIEQDMTEGRAISSGESSVCSRTSPLSEFEFTHTRALDAGHCVTHKCLASPVFSCSCFRDFRSQNPPGGVGFSPGGFVQFFAECTEYDIGET